MKLSILALSALFVMPAFANSSSDQPGVAGSSSEQQTTTSTTTTTEQQSAQKADSPKKACEMIAEAAKNKDFAQVKQLTQGGDKAMKMKGASKKDFDKMHARYSRDLQDLKCNSEEMAEDHAMVTAEAKGEKRLIPFVKQGETWKFDARTYMSFYRDSMKDMKHSG